MSDREDLSPIDFTTFVISLGSSTVMQLAGDAGEPDLVLARQNVDILKMLEVKTRGNLSPDEEQLLRGVLYQSRLAVVEGEKLAAAGE